MIAPVGAALASPGRTWSQPLGIGDRALRPAKKGEPRHRRARRSPAPAWPPSPSKSSPSRVLPLSSLPHRGGWTPREGPRPRTLAGGTRPGRGALGSAHGLRRARGAEEGTACQGRAVHGLPATGWMGQLPLWRRPSTTPRRGPSVDEGIRHGHLREKLQLLVAGDKPEGGPTRRTVAADLTPPWPFHIPSTAGSSPRVSVAVGPLQPISTPTI
jgi:hypothetical protein